MTFEENNQPADGQVKIPRELFQFLRQETYSLLIKGHTGTGKTTLALSILKELNLHKNCLYLSTRISPDQLFQYHPWIENFFDRSKAAESSDSIENKTNHDVFVDARLDEPVSLFERITNELMDVKAPTIIIDTWDAIGFLMDREALMNNAKVLQSWRERAGARLIFVTETPEDNAFDFLVDGIVELRQRHYNERRIREIFLSKLRGVRINKPSYIFSVNNGAFHSYEHYSPSEFLDLRNFLPKAANKEFAVNNHLSSGYHEFDKILGGGFPLGSTVSIELTPHVNAKVAFAFLGKIIAQFIASQNHILVHPFEKTIPEVLTRYQKSVGTQKDGLDIISPTVQKKSKASLESIIMKKITKIKKENSKKMLLSIVGPEMVNAVSKSETADFSDLFSIIKTNSDLTVIISRRTTDIKYTPVPEISDIRLSIHEIDGTIFLQSDIPWSELYAIVVRPEKDDKIRLEPIV